MSSPMIEEQEAEERAVVVGRQDPAAESTHARLHRRPLIPSLARWLTTSRTALALLVGLAAFLVYLRTLSISIAWGDSPELTSAAYNLGIPHPTGYPLYMLLSHTFLRLFPLGSVAY